MSRPAPATQGFLPSLLDLDFQHFITLRFLKVIYVFLLVVIGLGALFFFIALASRGAGAAVVGLVVVPLFALFYLVLARVYLEIIATLFRIAENTTRTVDLLARMVPPAPGPAAGWPGQGQPPYGPPGTGPV